MSRTARFLCSLSDIYKNCEVTVTNYKETYRLTPENLPIENNMAALLPVYTCSENVSSTDQEDGRSEVSFEVCKGFLDMGRPTQISDTA